jgi:hypothetical protein
MTAGQVRVFVLLLVLALLEVVVHPAVKSYWKTAYSSISASIARNKKAGSL